MSDNVGLQYSEQASINRYIFYKEINDINIFVEDKNKEYEYETIFKRMFKEKYNIKSIISVGGKPNLVKAYKQYGNVDSDNVKKINIYIADGDFDRLLDIEMVDSKNFIYLDNYNIENYFVDKKAVCSFVKGKIKKCDQEVDRIVKFDYWKDKIIAQAFELFLLYSAIKKYKPSIESVGRNEYKFIKLKNGFEIEGAYDKVYNEINNEIDNLKERLEVLESKYRSIYGNDNSKIICGKFMIISLYEYIRSITNASFSKDDFRWHLLSNFDINKLEYIKDRVDELQNAS